MNRAEKSNDLIYVLEMINEANPSASTPVSQNLQNFVHQMLGVVAWVSGVETRETNLPSSSAK
jgi:hypothetical protein